MRYVCPVAVAALLTSSVIFGQNAGGILSVDSASSLSITNYQFVSEQKVTRTTSYVTYRADLLNSGPAVGPMTATVTSLVASVQTVTGQDSLKFGPAPANSQVTALNTFTILVDRTVTFDFASLKWSFQVTAPVANAGANQSATVGSTVTLNGSGSTNPSGFGTLTYSWAFTSVPAGSAAILSNPTSVMATFVPDVAGSYVITLTVSNGVASGSASVTVSTTMPPPPVANAGANQTVSTGATVILNGSGSTSGSGKPLTYSWTMIVRPAGSAATLASANTVSPTFVADKFGSYTVQLIVNDTIANSAPSTVTVTTQTVKPVANAGSNQVVNVNSVVQLNGANSTDANGLPLTYQWSLISLPSSSAAALTGPTTVNPTFTADRPGTYIAQLIVNNGTLSSDPATVTITTNPPLAPTADAGPSQTVERNSTVTLNGKGTDPQGLPVTYQWALITKPTNSAASLSSATIANPTFIADLPGTYVAQLIVSNGTLSSTPSTVMISTTSTPPVANAGPNQNVAVGVKVTLDGSGSVDIYHDPLTYSWSFTTRPNNSAATLTGANTVSPSFTPDVAGVYVVQLIVNDGYTSSTPATVTITAQALTLTPNPLNLSYTPDQLTVVLSVPAGNGGQVVALTSSNTSIATIPASVTIPQGSMAANVLVSPGTTGGNATITATASGFQSATAQVKVTPGSLSFTPATLTITGTRTQNLTLTLSSPAPASGLSVNLSSSNPSVATVGATATFAAGATTTSVPVKGVAVGSTVIHASALPNLADTTANVTVVSDIILPANLTVQPGQTVDLPVSLASAAAQGGVLITLTVSDGSLLNLLSTSVYIEQGQTQPPSPPQVTGLKPGSVTITASAAGFLSTSQTVQVVPAATLSFSPASLTFTGTGTQNLTLNLSSPAPLSGLTVNLKSDNTGIATVAPTASFAPSAQSVVVPVTAVAAGSTTIRASALPNIAETTAGVTVNQATPASVTANSGSGQSAQINTAFTNPLSVTVKDASNNPIGGVTVTFAGPASGAGITTITATTNASGVASATVTANATVGGPYTVTATAGSASATFQLTNTAGAPASVMANSGSGQSTQISTAFANPLSVTVKDAGNNPISGVTVTFTGPASGAGITTATATTNASGVATATVTANATAGGPYTVTATAASVNATFQLTNTAGAVAAVTANSGTGQSAQINTAFANPLSVTVKDASNNPISGVTVTFTGPASGAGITTATATTNASGVASATVTANATVGGPYTVTATAGSANATFQLTNTAGTPASMTANSGTDQSAQINTAFANPLSVTVKDAGNNPVSGVTVTFTGPASGAGITTATATTNASGVASATVTANGTAGGPYTVTATAGSANATFQLTNTAGSVASVTANSGTGQSAQINTAFANPLSVTVKDAGNNPISGVTVTFAGPASGAGITTATATTNASGVATATVTANATVGGPYTVTATAGSASATFQLTNTVGAPASMTANSGTGQSAQINTAFANPLSVTVKDAGNNPVSGVTVTFTGPASGAGITTATATTDASGVATATVTANATVGGPYTVTATAGSASATFQLTNTVGAPASMTANSGTGQSAQINTAFANPLSVTVKDAGNNPVSGVTVTFTGPASGAGITTATATTNASGVASATVTANGTAGGPYTVTATAGSANATFQLTNTAPVPASVTANSGTGQSATVNTAFASPLIVTVKDAGNNPLSGVTVTFAGPASGASIGATTAVTNASGVASAIVTANATAGGPYTVTATAGSASATFQLTNIASIPGASITVTPVSVGQNLEVAGFFTLSTAPSAGGLSVKVTSSDPGKLLVAGGPSDPGAQSVTVTVAQGNTSGGVWLQGLASSGTASITVSAAGYQSGAAAITLTPSGILMAGPFGSATSFTTNVGATPTQLTLTSARLDSSFNLAEVQQVRGGYVDPSNPASGTFSASVSVTSSTPGVGTVTSPVAIIAGSNSATTQFTAGPGTGSTTLTAVAPTGFSTPVSGNSVTANVSAPVITCSAASVGNNLQATVSCSLVGGTPSSGKAVILTSDDISLIKLAPVSAGGTSCTAAGASSITVTTVSLPGGGVAMPSFCVYGLANAGAATYTINGGSMGYASSKGNVTLTPSGFVVSAGGAAIGTPNFYTLFTGSSPVTINIWPAQLDGGGNYVAVEPLAGGIPSVSVSVTSGTPSVGTITSSPVTVLPGTNVASTQFQPLSGGNSLISLSTPAGYSTPAAAYRTVTGTVPFNIIQVDGPANVGQNLQGSGTVTVSPAPTSNLVVTITSSDPNQILLSGPATGAGTASATITIPAGSMNGTFYVQALSGGPLVNGLVLHSNTPVAGSISWDAFVIKHQGTTYNIAAGNTSSPYVVWTPGAASVAGAANVTAPALLVATNASGTGSGGVSYTVSAPSYGSVTTSSAIAPSGVVFGTTFVLTTAGAAATPLVVSTAILNPDNTYGGTQALRGGAPSLQVSLQSGNPGIGTISSPITIAAGASSTTAQFTPLSSGITSLSLITPSGFVGSSNKTSVTAIVQ